MIKTARRYVVQVYLNDKLGLSCQLLTPPTVEALAEIAENEGASREVIEALSFSREVNFPDAFDESPCTTEIVIAGAVLGSICVTTGVIYKQPVKRGPKTAD